MGILLNFMQRKVQKTFKKKKKGIKELSWASKPFHLIHYDGKSQKVE